MSLSLCALSIKSHALHVYSPFPPSTPRGSESCSLPPAPCLPCWVEGGKLRHREVMQGGCDLPATSPGLFSCCSLLPKALTPCSALPRASPACWSSLQRSENPSWKASTARRRAGAFEERGTRVWDVSEGIWEAEERHSCGAVHPVPGGCSRSGKAAPGARGSGTVGFPRFSPLVLPALGSSLACLLS